jgi:tetratricopeptide (TPR) repeat protein
MYENMMKKFKVGGIAENPNIYLDENVLRMTVNIRGNFGRLAESLVAKGELEKAAAVIDYSLKVMPPSQVPHSVFDYSYPGIYYAAGQKEKARKLLQEMFDKAKDELNYYVTVYKYALNNAREAGDMSYYASLQQGAFMERREVREQLYIMQEMNLNAKKYDDADFATKVEKEFNDYRMKFVQMPQQPVGQPQ